MMRFVRTLPFRLNAGLIFIYLLSSASVFYFFNLVLQNYLNSRLDEYLETEVLSITSDINFEQLPANLVDVQRTFTRFGHSHGTIGAFVILLSSNGTMLASSDLKYFKDYDFQKLNRQDISGMSFVWRTLSLKDQPFRVIYYQTPDHYTIQIGFSLEETQELYHSLQRLFGTALFLILLAGGILGLGFSVYVLKGLAYLRDRAQSIRKRGDLTERVQSETGSQETDDLARSFNDMLGRIEDLVENLNYVMDNIAHDIRTPVTRMRGHAEIHLNEEDLTPREMEITGQVIEECDQILNLVNTLLEITAADSGLLQPRQEQLDAAQIVRDGFELFEPVWEAKRLQAELICPETLKWSGDPTILQRVLSNLLDNAIKYTSQGGSIHVNLDKNKEMLVLRVSDTGSGIDTNEQGLIFQRFYRCQSARGQKGNGLGLSFCKSIVEAVNGSLEVQSKKGEGTEFVLKLPGYID